ncbi:hypothetical protein ES705_33234 [subsurface metagenome]
MSNKIGEINKREFFDLLTARRTNKNGNNVRYTKMADAIKEDYMPFFKFLNIQNIADIINNNKDLREVTSTKEMKDIIKGIIEENPMLKTLVKNKMIQIRESKNGITLLCITTQSPLLSVSGDSATILREKIEPLIEALGGEKFFETYEMRGGREEVIIVKWTPIDKLKVKTPLITELEKVFGKNAKDRIETIREILSMIARASKGKEVAPQSLYNKLLVTNIPDYKKFVEALPILAIVELLDYGIRKPAEYYQWEKYMESKKTILEESNGKNIAVRPPGVGGLQFTYYVSKGVRISCYDPKSIPFNIWKKDGIVDTENIENILKTLNGLRYFVPQILINDIVKQESYSKFYITPLIYNELIKAVDNYGREEVAKIQKEDKYQNKKETKTLNNLMMNYINFWARGGIWTE